MPLGSRNFIGLELNKKIRDGKFDMTFRPQMRIVLSHKLIVGGLVGIPLNREKEGISGFMRIIYEP